MSGNCFGHHLRTLGLARFGRLGLTRLRLASPPGCRSVSQRIASTNPTSDGKMGQVHAIQPFGTCDFIVNWRNMGNLDGCRSSVSPGLTWLLRGVEGWSANLGP